MGFESSNKNENAPVLSEPEQEKEELMAGFNLRIGMLKTQIDRMGEKGTGVEESTMEGVEEDLTKIDEITKKLKNGYGPELLKKLNTTLIELRESINKKPGTEKEKAFSRVGQFVLDSDLNQ